MKLFATYCSANKDPASGQLPAIERYTSDRISGVYANAKSAGARFAILSGKFGLIDPDTPLEDYDHLLQPEGIAPMTARVAETLKAWEITEVHWFSVAFEMDPNVRRYKSVVENAASMNDIPFELEIWEPTGMLGLV